VTDSGTVSVWPGHWINSLTAISPMAYNPPMMSETLQEIQGFWLNILKALSTVAGLLVLLVAHSAVEALLSYVLGTSELWMQYHQWIEGVTFGAFYTVYVFLLLEFIALFVPSWLRTALRLNHRSQIQVQELKAES